MLKSIGDWSYIFANFHAEGRQIDLAVFTARTSLLIEAKSYNSPVFGEINGQWLQSGPAGNRKIRNAFNQALEAKNALRDVLQQITKISGYPNAVVAVIPRIPNGSSLTSGDFKVRVGGGEIIISYLSKSSGATLNQQDCVNLATKLGLESLSHKEAALDDMVLQAERSCNEYCKAFKAFYGTEINDFIPDVYAQESNRIGPNDVYSLLKNMGGLIIVGPSGCGKSLLSTYCACLCNDEGYFPIFLLAKDFNGDFHKALDKEVALLSGARGVDVIKAAQILRRKIVLFIDGYNECKEDLRVLLTRSIKAFSRRYSAGVVLSSQHEILRSDLLNLKLIEVNQPSRDLKIRISGINMQDAGESDGLLHMLEIINSGLEASLVREVRLSVSPNVSRFVLFITYARIKLRNTSIESIRLLSLFAEKLVQSLRFSLSLREFDRLCDSINLSQDSRAHLSESRLLHERGDRISFSHELYFAVFSAESAVRAANDDVEKMLGAIRSPRFSKSKTLLLGAVEDPFLLKEVIERCNDSELIEACSRGECGCVAQSVVNENIQKALEAMIVEARGIRFRVDGEGMHGIKIDDSSLLYELRDFDIYLGAIGFGLRSGKYHDSVMNACFCMDEAIVRFTKATESEATDIRIPVLHATFSGAYVFGASAAVSKIVQFVHRGGLSFRHQEGPMFRGAICGAWKQAQSYGQYYYLVGITKCQNYEDEVAPYIINLINSIKSCPYHLRLDLIDYAGGLGEADKRYRQQLIASLENCLNSLGAMMNSVIFESLRGLGALDQDEIEYSPIVRQELDQVLRADSEQIDQLAWALFSCQFDHPYEIAYWNEIQALEKQDKQNFLIKACRGAGQDHVFFLSILIRELADFGGLDAVPAIARWLSLPKKDAFYPQEAAEVFIAAHESLGYLGVPLPQGTSFCKVASEVDRAILACGELYYWANRLDVEDPQEATCTLDARRLLLENLGNSAAGVLQISTTGLLSRDSVRKPFLRVYPKLAGDICRQALSKWDQQASYFSSGPMNDELGIAEFCIQVLNKLGDQQDILILRSFCDHEKLGKSAINAIGAIEERFS